MAYSGNESNATHFAITTVNVPDRLDLRDMDDRKHMEDDNRERSFDAAAFRTWLPRLLLIGLISGLAFVLFELIDTWHTALSAPQLSQRLSNTLGVPVRVESSQLIFFPKPQLVMRKVNVNEMAVLDTISVNVSTKHIAQYFQGHGWNWGEAVVGASSLTLAQCQQMANLIPHLDAALPSSLASLRIEHLEIPDQNLFPGAWDVSIARVIGKGFLTAAFIQHSKTGSLQIQFTPSVNPALIDFELEARNWVLPFGPTFAIEEAVASGQLSLDHVELHQFSLGGPFGAVRGQISASLDKGWTIDGAAQTEGIDLDALIRQMTPPAGDASKQDTPSVMQGTASFDGKFSGHGNSLEEAIGATVFQAPVHVRSPVLNGINLGFAATHPGANESVTGGSTRFSTLEAQIDAHADQVTFRDIRAHAGALAAFGQVSVAPSHALSGLLHVDLGATRVLAPIRVGVHGTIIRPEFGH